MALDQATVEWIEAAMVLTPFGEVVLVMNEGQVSEIRTTATRRMHRPRDKYCMNDGAPSDSREAR